MGQARDTGWTTDSVIERAARLAVALVVLGTVCTGAAVAVTDTPEPVNGTTPSVATPAPAADDPGVATGPADAGSGSPIPAATGPAAGAGVAAGLAVAVGLFARFEYEG